MRLRTISASSTRRNSGLSGERGIARSSSRTANCPACGAEWACIHAKYQRFVSHLSFQVRAVRVNSSARRSAMSLRAAVSGFSLGGFRRLLLDHWPSGHHVSTELFPFLIWPWMADRSEASRGAFSRRSEMKRCSALFDATPRNQPKHRALLASTTERASMAIVTGLSSAIRSGGVSLISCPTATKRQSRRGSPRDLRSPLLGGILPGTLSASGASRTPGASAVSSSTGTTRTITTPGSVS